MYYYYCSTGLNTGSITGLNTHSSSGGSTVFNTGS